MAKEVVYDDTVDVRVSPLVPMTPRELVSTILTGVAVGLLVAVLYFLLNKFVFGAVLCRPQSTADCSQAPNYSMIVALIVASIAGVAGLARARVYRPLLIVLAAAIALWGFQSAVTNVVWYWALLATMVLFGLAYGLFGWLARIRNFILALVVTIVIVILVRWVLVA